MTPDKAGIEHLIRHACVPGVAALLIGGCSPFGSFDLDLYGGGGSCSDGGTPAMVPAEFQETLCERLSECFPTQFAASYPDANPCEYNISSIPSLPCSATSEDENKCVMDLHSSPCPGCLAPLTEDTYFMISAAAAFLPQSCQSLWTDVSFIALSTQDAECMSGVARPEDAGPDAAPED